MKAVKLHEVEVKGESLEEAVAMIKKATAGTKPMYFEICASYKEEEQWLRALRKDQGARFALHPAPRNGGLFLCAIMRS